MNTRDTRRAVRRGTTLIFALVILAVTAMVLGGLVFTMGALVRHTVESETAMSRRLELENSRALAVQFVRGMVLASNSTTGVTNTAVTVGGHYLGGLTLTNANGLAWTNAGAPAGMNPFSPAGITRVTSGGTSYYYPGFSGTLTGVLPSGTNLVDWIFEVRTRTPTLGYDLATYVVTATNGNVSSEAAVGATNGTYYSGTLVNGAFPPDILTSGSTFYALSPSGTINVSGSSSTSEYMVSGGTVTLYLNGLNQARTFRITGTLKTLVFNYDGSFPHVPGYPLKVMAVGLATSSTVDLTKGSVRPVYLFYENSQPVTIRHTSTPRLTMVFSGSQQATIDAGTIRGGLIRRGPGGSLGISGGTLSILRETDPGTLDEVALRRGWVESYRND
jgi:hypothetical protein